ncbi:MAG: ClpXP protease specificity-enhancing factor [Pontibacterium sp.]
MLKPSRPYLVNALYEWILDIEDVPYLVVDVTWPNVDAPLEYAQDGRLILNVSPTAVQYFQVNDAVTFTARFSGVSREVYVPMGAVLAIYGRDTGEGMGFGMEPCADLLEPQAAGEFAQDTHQAEQVEEDNIAKSQLTQAPETKQKSKRPTLRVVK